MKPILFNTAMVEALLDDRKTVTRRAVKPQHLRVLDSPYHKEHPETPDKVLLERLCDPPYRPGDILYARETWAHPSDAEVNNGADPQMYLYKADVPRAAAWDKWRPSIHMPREAARIFLRVTDVRVERLWAVEVEDVLAEGVTPISRPGGCRCQWAFDGCMDGPCSNRTSHEIDRHIEPFARLWDSTIKPADRALYGWDANPWVWVIEFERITKEEAYGQNRV